MVCYLESYSTPGVLRGSFTNSGFSVPLGPYTTTVGLRISQRTKVQPYPVLARTVSSHRTEMRLPGSHPTDLTPPSLLTSTPNSPSHRYPLFQHGPLYLFYNSDSLFSSCVCSSSRVASYLCGCHDISLPIRH